MEITEHYSPAEIDFYTQIHEKIPNYIMHIDAGYCKVKVKISNINSQKNRITFKVDDKDAEKLLNAVNESMARRSNAGEGHGRTIRRSKTDS